MGQKLQINLNELAKPFEDFCRAEGLNRETRADFVRALISAAIGIKEREPMEEGVRLNVRITQEGYARMKTAMDKVGIRTPSHYFDFLTRQTLHEFSVPMHSKDPKADPEALSAIKTSNLEMVRLNNRISRVVDLLKGTPLSLPRDVVDSLSSVNSQIKDHIRNVYRFLGAIPLPQKKRLPKIGGKG